MSGANPLRVVLKSLLVFAVLNLVFAELNAQVGRLSMYNCLVKGGQRFPVSEPDAAHFWPLGRAQKFLSVRPWDRPAGVIQGSPAVRPGAIQLLDRALAERMGANADC